MSWAIAKVEQGRVVYGTWEGRVILFPSERSALRWAPPGARATEFPVTYRGETLTHHEWYTALLRRKYPDYDHISAWAILAVNQCRRCRSIHKYLTYGCRPIVFPSPWSADFIMARMRAKGMGGTVVEYDGDMEAARAFPIDYREVWAPLNIEQARRIKDANFARCLRA